MKGKGAVARRVVVSSRRRSAAKGGEWGDEMTVCSMGWSRLFPAAVGRRGASMLTPYCRPEGIHYAGFEKSWAADSDIPDGPRRSLRSRAGRVNCDMGFRALRRWARGGRAVRAPARGDDGAAGGRRRCLTRRARRARRLRRGENLTQKTQRLRRGGKAQKMSHAEGAEYAEAPAR